MSHPLRRAGSGRDAAGALLTWTVAEGRRGRRWREVRVVDGSVAGSLLLETSADGRFAHTEYATAAGLLTLHPEGDGTLHGNVVTRDGVAHVVGLPWPSDAVVLVAGSTIGAAAVVHGLGHGGGGVAPGTAMALEAVVVGADLALASRSIDVARTADGAAWRVDGVEVALDSEGLPVLADGRSWPLEQD